MYRGNRRGAGGDGGPHPGRQAKCASEEGHTRIPGEIGARGHESVRGAAMNKNEILKRKHKHEGRHRAKKTRLKSDIKQKVSLGCRKQRPQYLPLTSVVKQMRNPLCTLSQMLPA